MVCYFLAKKSRQSGMTSHFFVPQGTHGSWRGSAVSGARHCENRLRGVRSTRRPACRAFVYHRSATPNTGRSACRLFSGAVSIPPQGICH